MVAWTPESRKQSHSPAPQHRVDERPAHAEQVGHDERREERGPDPQSPPRDLRGIEQRDHQDRHYVVHDGQRRQEHLERRRCPPTEQGQEPEGECYVGGHRDTPARRARRPCVVREVDQRGHHRPAQGSGHGQHRVACRGELSHQNLALDLQADHQEENGHESVVDPVGQVLGYGKVAHAHSELRVPQRDVALCPRGVGPREGDHGGGYQEDAAGGLLVGEVLEGTYDPLHRRPLSRYAHVAHRTRASTARTSQRLLFTLVRGIRILRSSYPRSCIASPRTPENTRPGTLHSPVPIPLVTPMDRYARSWMFFPHTNVCASERTPTPRP